MLNRNKPILAIDPGNEQSAYVIFDGVDILRFGIMANEELLSLLTDLGDPFVSDGYLLAIEMIASYGMPVGGSVFETCVWIGRFIQKWSNYGPSVTIKRLEVKLHICHDSKAKDANIRQALLDRFGKPGTKKHPGKTYGISKDIWAALAVAVTVHEQLPVEPAYGAA